MNKEIYIYMLKQNIKRVEKRRAKEVVRVLELRNLCPGKSPYVAVALFESFVSPSSLVTEQVQLQD